MRIALDGACLSPRLTGVGRYFQSLLEELLPLDHANEYTLFLKEDFATGLDFPNLHTQVLAGPGSYLLWQNTQLRKAVLRGGFDLFWSANYTLPFFLPVPSLLTVHDISWKALPGDYSPLNRLYRNIAGNRSFRKARVLFTDSDFSRNEIIRRAGVPAAKVKRVHLGVDARFRRAAAGEIEAWKAGHGLAGKRLIGFLGDFFRRRHVPEIIAAHKVLQKQHPGTVLLLIGENHGVPESSLKKNKADVLWLRRLPENELNAFYSSLSLFLYLSEYEGFGLPPMEALNCGTVSLLLRGSSLEELYGNIALFVDRPDPEIVAGTISQFLAAGAGGQATAAGRLAGPQTVFFLEESGGGVPPGNAGIAMQVIIDGRPLQTYSAFRGIGRYVRNIMDTFGRDERANFLFFRGNDVPSGTGSKVFSASPRRMITLTDSFFLPGIFSRRQPACYHSTAYALPREDPERPLSPDRYRSDAAEIPAVFSLAPPAGFQADHRSRPSAPTACWPSRPKPQPTCRNSFTVHRKKDQSLYNMLDERFALAPAIKPDVPCPGEFLLYTAAGPTG